MTATPSLSDAEWQVMQVLWRRGTPALAQEIYEALAQETGWSLATLKTFLNRLVQKGALLYEKEGRAFRYRPAHSEEAHRQRASRGFLKRMFGGAFAPMMAHFIEAQPMTEEEIRELEALLKAKKPSSDS